MGVEERIQMEGVENICTYVRGNTSKMEKIAYQGTLGFILFTKENRMGRACRTCGRDEKCIQSFGYKV